MDETLPLDSSGDHAPPPPNDLFSDQQVDDPQATPEGQIPREVHSSQETTDYAAYLKTLAPEEDELTTLRRQVAELKADKEALQAQLSESQDREGHLEGELINSDDEKDALADRIVFLEEEVEKSYVDTLTGLANQNAYLDKVPELVEKALANGDSLALISFDVDGLKRTNDALGHPMGDELLKEVGPSIAEAVAEALQDTLRDEDITFKTGGDEFVTVAPNMKVPEDENEKDFVNRISQRIKAKFIKRAMELGIPERLFVGLSIGFTFLDPTIDTGFDDFKIRSDQALYIDKNKTKAELKARGFTFNDDREIDTDKLAS